jgi:hypothetical protein
MHNRRSSLESLNWHPSRLGAGAVGKGYSHRCSTCRFGMVLYLPQFFGPPWMRIARVLVLGVGLVLVAFQMPRKIAG